MHIERFLIQRRKQFRCCVGFGLLRFVIEKKSRHFLNHRIQNHYDLPARQWFSAFGASSSDWFSGLSVYLVISQNKWFSILRGRIEL